MKLACEHFAIPRGQLQTTVYFIRMRNKHKVDEGEICTSLHKMQII